MNSLIEESKDTLEELSVVFCYNLAIQEKILELESMPELRVLNFNFGAIETIREIAPRLIIDRNEIRIAKFWISDPCLSNGKDSEGKNSGLEDINHSNLEPTNILESFFRLFANCSFFKK